MRDLISGIMSKEIQVIGPSDSVQKAAQMMRELNIGSIPVCDENKHLIGMLTDRDITIRSAAFDKVASMTLIKEIMTEDIQTCFYDQTIEDIQEKMSCLQHRRIPIVNHQQELVGIVSLGDLATRQSCLKAGEVLKDVSGRMN